MFPIESNPGFINTPTPEPKADAPADTVPQGIDRSIGEGGFYAKILFQDEVYPWRYAFVQLHRMWDPTYKEGNVAHPEIVFFNSFYDQQDDGTTIPTAPGEMSLYNIGNEAKGKPASQMPTTDVSTLGYIQEGEVILWAEEVNRNQSVPHGAKVWMRHGAVYPDVNAGFPAKDYTFQWQAPLFAQITGLGFNDGAAHESETNPGTRFYNGDYQWVEMYRKRDVNNADNPSNLKWAKVPNGYQSSTNSDNSGKNIIDPAREFNGQPVAVGSIVKLYPGQPITWNADGTLYSQEWLFDAPQVTNVRDFGTAGTIAATVDRSNPSCFTWQKPGYWGSQHGTQIRVEEQTAEDGISFTVGAPSNYLLTINFTVTLDHWAGAAGDFDGTYTRLSCDGSIFPADPKYLKYTPDIPGFGLKLVNVTGGDAGHGSVTNPQTTNSEICPFTLMPGGTNAPHNEQSFEFTIPISFQRGVQFALQAAIDNNSYWVLKFKINNCIFRRVPYSDLCDGSKWSYVGNDRDLMTISYGQ